MAASPVAAPRRPLALFLLVVAFSAPGGAGSKSFNITNSCSCTVWPAISSSWASSATGFELAPGQWEIVPVPSGWSGRVWGRTQCSTDSTGRFTCVTGDCGMGLQDCDGGNAVPPATLAQFTMDGSGGMDTYDVSLVDGFNLPLLVAPHGAAPAVGNCAPTGCVADLNAACPSELRVTSASAGTGGAAVACKSACLAFGSPQYCCTGEHANPSTCDPTAYSQFFKSACPRAFSYAYDGAGSTFTCAGGDTYTITFCQGTTSGKPFTSPNSEPPAGNGNLPLISGGNTTPYTGGGSEVGATSGPWRIVLVVAVLGAVTAALGVLAKFLGLFKLCCTSPEKR